MTTPQRRLLRGLRHRRAGGGERRVRAGVRDHAVDPGQAARLRTLSAQLTAVDAFAAAA